MLSDFSRSGGDLVAGNAITPAEVREAVRRFTQVIGPVASQSV